MRARYLCLAERDPIRAAIWLSVAIADLAIAVSVCASMILAGVTRDPILWVVFISTAMVGGISATFGIGYAVRASFGLDIPEEEGPRE